MASPALVFRRGRLRMAAWSALLNVFWVFAGVFAFGFCVGLLPLNRWSIEKAWVLCLFGVVAFSSARAAITFRAWLRGFRDGLLELDEHGARFRSTEFPDTRLSWSEISAVHHERTWVSINPIFGYPLDTYQVESTQGAFTFSAMDIPSPMRAACEIAARSGAVIQDARRSH